MVHHGDHGARPPWAELPADALSEIAGHLHETADFVRFHAVCKPWREAPCAAPSFLPYLVSEGPAWLYNPGAQLRSPFSAESRYLQRFQQALAALGGKMVEGSGDIATGRVLAVGGVDRTAVLVNPLTGDATSLPPLPRKLFPLYGGWPSVRGVVSENGVVMFYTGVRRPFFLAVLPRPGEEEAGWEEVKTDGAWVLDGPMRRAVALRASAGILPGGEAPRAIAELPQAATGIHPHVIESHGELLCIDDVLRIRQEKAQTLVVRALEGGEDGRPRWVEREHGRGVEHLCFFLNWGDSSGFAVDAREFAGGEVTGGCAYFVDQHGEAPQMDAVYRYSFKDGVTTVVDELPAPFDRTSTWFMPRPRISAVRSSRLDR